MEILNGLESDIRILTDIIGRGEVIQGSLSHKEAPTLFLQWAPDVKDFLEHLATSSVVKYETRKRLKPDLRDVHSITANQVGPKLNRMLNDLNEVLAVAKREPSADAAAPSKGGPTTPNVKAGAALATTFDEYVLEDQLGQGGSGTVFKAKASDGSPVAVKVLRTGLSLEKTKRFKNEIAFCQKNSHTGIIRIIDHGLVDQSDERRPFYVMPLYAQTLRDYIKNDKGRAKLGLAITSILDAVEAAHLRDCFHRDIKPENILVNSAGDQFVLSDFGIAHFEEEDLATPVETLHADRLANFHYAAPEQKVKGQPVDHRADIYALGLIINEMFTGAVPHGTGFKKIADSSPDQAYLDEVVDKMIHQSPDRRHQTIEEVKNDLIKKNKLQVSFQKLDVAKKTVVPESDISGDPLISNPVKVVDVDHDGRSITCVLNHSLPETWTNLFGTGSFSWNSSYHPKLARCRGNKIIMDSRIEDGPQVKSFIDEWISSTNDVYKNNMESMQRKVATERRDQLAAQAELERKRQNFLRQVKV